MSAHFNLTQYCVAENARLRPLAPALCFADWTNDNRSSPELSIREWTFIELERRILQVADSLRRYDVPPGERLLVRLPHSPEFAFAFFGAIAAGLVAVPVSPRLTATEIAFLISDARPALLCHDDTLPLPDHTILSEHRVRAITVPEISGDPKHAASDASSGSSAGYARTASEDPAFLVYTSGTTGRPKGVLHAQRSVIGRRPMIADWTDLRASDRLLHAGELNWTYSLGVGLMDPWSVGAAGLLYRGPSDPTIWPRLITELGATIFAAVPALYRRILKYNDLSQSDLSKLRHGLTAGEALSAELYADWTRATNKPLYEALGMSEISTYISSGPRTPTRPGSPGRPQAGRSIAIIKTAATDTDTTDESSSLDSREWTATASPEFCATDEPGLLAVRRDDPGLMLGYWNRPEEDRRVYAGEWFIGGDLAACDADGYVKFYGRGDDVMNASGYRVAPVEVERVLQEHPAVLEVAVCETSPAAGIRVITAFVVPRDATLIHSRERVAAQIVELQNFVANRLADYKRPREYVFRAELPRTMNGKVIKSRL